MKKYPHTQVRIEQIGHRAAVERMRQAYLKLMRFDSQSKDSITAELPEENSPRITHQEVKKCNN